MKIPPVEVPVLATPYTLSLGRSDALPQAHDGTDYLLKLAFTDKLALTVTVQVLTVPLHAPDQLANVLPAGGVAVSVTAVPVATVAEHVVPQLMPPTSLVTTPGLLVLTLNWKPDVVPPPPPPPAGSRLKVAPTVLEPFTVTKQAAVPVQAPVQPTNTLPLLALAVSVVAAPAG